MTAIEFIKENCTLVNGGEDYRCNHSGQLVGAENIAEEYHLYKLKLLGMANVVGISKQLPVNSITDKEYKYLMKELYPKDNSKRFRR